MHAAHGTPLTADSNAQVAMASAMHRLARLRARGRNWSDGPASLLAWGNVDGEDLWGELPPAASAAAPPLELRGRLDPDQPHHTPSSQFTDETTVKLTRSLRLRGHPCEASAFAENADFGFLQGDHDKAAALWFLSETLEDSASSPAADLDHDVDASFPDWQVNSDGLIVVTAPDLGPVRAQAPAQLITEEELDALFARVDEARRVVLDDLNEDPRWVEPYWSDVDSYLAQVAETMDPSLLDSTHPLPEYDLEIHDLEIRDPEDAAPIAATHFWMPGDDAELAIAGEGDDLFIVGASEDAATVLVEDGATWSMRTGGSARMDEVVVSLSSDIWSDIDAMSWRRIAALSGVSEVRVEQNARGSRRAVMAGIFFAGGDEPRVRLVRSGDDGEEDFPVTRPAAGDLALFAELH